MLKVNLYDSNFTHSINEDGFITSSMGVRPSLIEWVEKQNNWGGITVFTDRFIGSAKEVTSKWKVAWLIEPKSIHPWIYTDIIKYEDDFDLIFTHDRNLISRNPDKYKVSVIASTRIDDRDIGIHPKTKLLSIIASHKTQSVGHLLRHAVVREYGDKMDVWGSGYKWFDSKIEPLKDYMFSIAIMNTREDNFFTEVLVDCFMFGTVPIFWGCDNIWNFFDSNGIIHFKKIEELGGIIENLTPATYEAMRGPIENNLVLAQDYKSTDDILAKQLMKEFSIDI